MTKQPSPATITLWSTTQDRAASISSHRSPGPTRPDQIGHQLRPPLVARPQSSAVLTMKIFIKRHVVTPVRVGLEQGVGAEDGTPAVPRLVAQEEPGQAAGELIGHLPQRDPMPRMPRQLDSDSTQFSGWEGQAHTDTLLR